MTVDNALPVFARARLRRDVPGQCLAQGAGAGRAGGAVWRRALFGLGFFADGPSRRRDFLWRETRPGEFLILGARRPTDPHRLFALECGKPFAPVLRPGQRLAFDLRANPVVSGGGKPGERGKRHDVVMHALWQLPPAERAFARERKIREAGADWLVRKATAAGVSLNPDELYVDGYERIRIPRHGARPVALSTLTFQGRLTVDEPGRFLAAILKGFGAAKGYGCGLMLIRRPA